MPISSQFSPASHSIPPVMPSATDDSPRLSVGPLVFLVVLLMCGGALAWGFWDKSNRETAAARGGETAQAFVALSTDAPTSAPTATDSPTPVPTIDYSAVYPAQTAASAAHDLALAQSDIAGAAATQAAAAATLVGATQQGYANALLIGTPTAIARATESAMNTEQAAQNAQAVYIEQETARIKAGIEQDRQDAERSEWLRFAVQMGGLLAGLMVFAGVVSVVVNREKLAEWQRVTADTSDNLLDNLQPQTDERPGFVPVSDGAYHSANVPVADKVFRAWAERMLAGETAGINKWETAESPFGRVGYKPFLAWAEERGYVEERGGAKVLSDVGRNFCAGWLARRATPPPLTVQTHETA